MEEKKSLRERFLKEGKLNIVDELRIKISQYLTDCDGTCGVLCDIWYCETRRGTYSLNQ